MVEVVAPDVTDAAGRRLVWGIWGHRSEAVVPADRLAGHLLPPGLDPLAGVFARVGAIALNAVLAPASTSARPWSVFGQGVIGLLATRAGRLTAPGCWPSTRCPRRLARAAAYGADPVPRRRRRRADVRRAHRGAGRGRRDRDHRRVPGAARGDPLRRRRRHGSWPPASTRATGTALRLGEEFHHNRVQLVSSQIGGVPPRSRGGGTGTAARDLHAACAPRGRSTRCRWSATSSPADGAAEAYALLDDPPTRCSRWSWSSGAGRPPMRHRDDGCLPGATPAGRHAEGEVGVRAAPASTRIELRGRGRLRVRRPAARAAARRRPTAWRCRPSAWRCCTSSATSTPTCGATRSTR